MLVAGEPVLWLDGSGRGLLTFEVGDTGNETLRAAARALHGLFRQRRRSILRIETITDTATEFHHEGLFYEGKLGSGRLDVGAAVADFPDDDD